MNSVFRETSELLDIINYNEKILNILKDKNYFENKSEEHNFLKIISGVGFINTIYEKFSRALLNIYCSIKNEKIDKYIKYKSLAKLKEFVKELNLDLENQYNLRNFKKDFLYKNLDYNGMLQLFLDSYKERCNYLHGDFDLEEKITLEKYNRSVIEILEIENIVMKILRDTFIERIPNIILETG